MQITVYNNSYNLTTKENSMIDDTISLERNYAMNSVDIVMADNNLIKTIDTLGIIDKQIKDLEATARKLKDALIARGVGKYDGNLFQVNVQQFDRAAISPTLVRELADDDFVSSVTEVKTVNAVVVKPLSIG